MAVALSAVAAPPAAPKQNPATARLAAAQERETLDSVVAASLVGALSEQLGGRAVKLRLGRVDVQTTSLRDRRVSGQGEAQIGNAEEWIGFRFVTLYDAILESAGYPELDIGTAGPVGRSVPNDAALVRELDDHVVAKLGEEFGGQRVRLQLDRIATIEAGPRYSRIDATGIADFGRDGTAPVRVEGLYDRIDKAWLRASYTLDEDAGIDPGSPSPAAHP
ncbi:MAG: hypothetical protein ACTHOH_18260 [Lysobacteraceae bacterium]